MAVAPQCIGDPVMVSDDAVRKPERYHPVAEIIVQAFPLGKENFRTFQASRLDGGCGRLETVARQIIAPERTVAADNDDLSGGTNLGLGDPFPREGGRQVRNDAPS